MINTKCGTDNLIEKESANVRYQTEEEKVREDEEPLLTGKDLSGRKEKEKKRSGMSRKEALFQNEHPVIHKMLHYFVT